MSRLDLSSAQERIQLLVTKDSTQMESFTHDTEYGLFHTHTWAYQSHAHSWSKYTHLRFFLRLATL